VTRRAGVFAIALALLWGCGDDGGPRPHPDVTPPATVRDLRVEVITAASVELAWTAPGDDSLSGTAAVYDIRYALSDTIRWENMTPVPTPPTAQHAGSPEYYTLTDLLSNTSYTLRLATGDEVPNWSAPSAAVTAKTERAVPTGYVLVPAGTFTMGDGAAPCGTDQHEASLTHEFLLGVKEITNQEYLDMLRWAKAQGYVEMQGPYYQRDQVVDQLDGGNTLLLDLGDSMTEISYQSGQLVLWNNGHGINPDHPIGTAKWYGAAAYCDWLNLKEGLPRSYNHSTWECNGGDPYGAVGYRLPTDAEWEYAARYGDGRVYPWGNEAPDCARVNWWGREGGCEGWTIEVGSYPAGPVIGPRGFYDLAGNVWEWCQDRWMCDLGTQPVIDPVGPSIGNYRVQRGGSWAYSGTAYLRCAARGVGDPGGRAIAVGFRVARTAK
jgi:formylglycine-generating enzyme required for sulfatase activity